MSDSDFVDVGDELVVRVGGFPIGFAKVVEILPNRAEEVKLEMEDHHGEVITFYVPGNIKQYDTVDGYGHNSQPLTGVEDETMGRRPEGAT